ncbi:hypothetical protein [Natrialba aegyptia]|uniref:Uncharacterized protein n=1 Tax=Natrialba aegyptia DSM 13077 TaxID=1227491 RepID=M0BBZ5_9EURY|nr:hypothetical protein [Natrialba aegyptia]ELZ07977.1 hypothetical protein C480_03949 [Natrialba aegyptia DSM 13077]
MAGLPDAFSRLRRPEYTGANRCLPCTIGNVAIALGGAVGFGVAISEAVGAVALVAFLGIIALRGYLLPGTPTLTRRYLPDRVHAAVGTAADRQPSIDTAEFESAVRALSAAGVIEERADGPRLTTGFATQWDDRLSTIAGSSGTDHDGSVTVDAAAVAAAFDAETATRRGVGTVELDGEKLVRWPSDAALAADVAAARELESRLDGWDAVDTADRRATLTGLRILRDRCPVCGGPLSRRVERDEHCCRRPQVGIERVCRDCDRVLVSTAVSETSSVLAWIPGPGSGNR